MACNTTTLDGLQYQHGLLHKPMACNTSLWLATPSMAYNTSIACNTSPWLAAPAMACSTSPWLATNTMPACGLQPWLTIPAHGLQQTPCQPVACNTSMACNSSLLQCSTRVRIAIQQQHFACTTNVLVAIKTCTMAYNTCLPFRNLCVFAY